MSNQDKKLINKNSFLPGDLVCLVPNLSNRKESKVFGLVKDIDLNFYNSGQLSEDSSQILNKIDRVHVIWFDEIIYTTTEPSTVLELMARMEC